MKMKRIATNYNKKEFFKEMELVETASVGAMNVINIYPEITYQTIAGFGGAFTEASGCTLSCLSDEKREEVINAYFGESGICYNIGRTHINSCDFALDNYAYMDDETDMELEKFDRSRDRKYIVPMIQDAQKVSKNPIKFLASPWSPPAFMKTNGDMNHGGKLKVEYKKLWAKYIAKYIKDCLLDGIEISMITVQNEPEATQVWDSCRYTAMEEMEFVRDYLGPTLKEEGLSHVKIFVWDHNKELMYERAKDILSDETANSYVAGIAFHWYTGDHFEAVALVKEKFPEKELYFTEGCVEYSRFADSDEVYKAEMYGHDILGNLNVGMNGYIDWNLVLNEEGGPNHVGNFCAAPIMCNTKENTIDIRLSYYYIGHFSRYIKPGAKRIATTRYTDAVDVTAVINPDGERIIILMNRTNKDLPITLREYGMGYDFTIESHTIVTLCCC